MKKLPKKFDIVDVLIWMLIAVAIFLLCCSNQVKTYYNFQEEPLREASIRVKEITGSDYVTGKITYWNISGEHRTMPFGDITIYNLEN